PDQQVIEFKEVAVVEEQRIPTPPVLPPVVEKSTPVIAIAAPEPEPAVEEVEIADIIPLASTTPEMTFSSKLEDGLSLLDNNQLAAAQRSLSASLRGGALTPSEEAQARGVLADIADDLIFSRNIDSSDPFSIDYTVRGGDTLSGIVNKMGLQVDWRFIQRINGIKKPSGIRVGQNLKLVTGPFHAVIDKDTYRADIFLGDGNDRVLVRSFRVGLGEYNSTPTGLFKVRKNSKLINPPWTNPRTREFFGADNPQNPIGEHWIGLEGIEERTKDLTGLGMHGTIDPDSIGKDASMGCVRMQGDDVAQAYEMLVEGVSTVEIR
ncbi:MAG: L,D-transpeptidase family protein, partial [Planctomycetes bacterium]|nr:L,D-transpeptidase family protein [Planctomycetota bacterium]